MPRPKPLVALHGAVNFERLIPFDPAVPLGVNDLLVMRREAGGPNVTARVGDVQAHTGGAVDISALLGGVDDDMMYRVAGVWTGTGGTGLTYNGVQFKLPQANTPAAPTFAFGDGDSGFYENADDFISVAIAGVRRFAWGSNKYQGITVGSAAMQNLLASGIVPTLLPHGSSDALGIGAESTTILSLIATGVQIAQAKGVGGAHQFIVLPGIATQNTPATPALQIGSAANGFYVSAANVISVSLAGVAQFQWNGDLFRSENGSGPGMRNLTGSATIPTVLARHGDPNTGLAAGGDDILSLVSGAVAGMQLTELSSGVYHAFDSDVAVTAFAGGGNAGATQLDSGYNVITTVATGGDSVKLTPAVRVGTISVIKNDGANACDVFPAIGDDLGLGVNVPFPLAAASVVSFMGTIANSTWTQLFGLGTGGPQTFTELVYNAVDFDNPNNADWDVNALAPAVADSNNAALTIRAFDDTIVEGVGGFMHLPVGATTFTFNIVGRAETTPPGTRVMRFSLRVREIPDNGTPTSPPWITGNFANFDIPISEVWLYDAQSFTFAFFGFAPGELIQFELVRVGVVTGTDLEGDYDLLRLRIAFS